MTEQLPGYHIRAEGDKLACESKDGKHEHDCKTLVSGFRVMLAELRKQKKRIQDLEQLVQAYKDGSETGKHGRPS